MANLPFNTFVAGLPAAATLDGTEILPVEQGGVSSQTTTQDIADLATGSGTVTSVALADASTTPIYAVSGSPVTTSGTLTETLKTQSANTVFAGPTTGSAAQPAFRALVVADIPPAVIPNIDADTHPTVTNPANDEFEFGTSIDTTGARFSGATPWTALNGSTSSTAIANGSLLFSGALVTGTNAASYVQPVSGSTYTYQCKFSLMNDVSGYAGMVIQNSANSHLLTFGVNCSTGTGTMVVQRLTNPTTFSANVLLSGTVPTLVVISTLTATTVLPFYLQISYNGTNINFSVSRTGISGSFQQVYTETSGTFLAAAPTNIGLMILNNITSPPPAIAIYDWFRKVA